jgi:Na+-transporting NADH:ubiquinone oxidoreductase subunit NqrA
MIGFQKENFKYLSYTDNQYAVLQRQILRFFWLESTLVDFNVSTSGGTKSIQKVR